MSATTKPHRRLAYNPNLTRLDQSMQDTKKVPEISVIMAVYNGEKCLKKTIDSILNQTFRDIEFLIVDDASTDNTISFINSYRDSRIKLICNRENLGQTASLNIGINHAKGRFLARIDADDHAMPNRLSAQYEFMTHNPQYSVVGTDCIVFDNDDVNRSVSRGLTQKDHVIVKLMTGGSPINHISVLMKSDDIVSVGGYNDEFKIVADLDLWSRLVRNGRKITTIPEVLNAYRSSDISYTAKNYQLAIAEKTTIFYENIKTFTNVEIDKNKVNLVTRLFSDEFENMGSEEIDIAEKTYMAVLNSIKPELDITVSEREVRKALAQNYWISSYHKILLGKNREARQVIANCIKRHGLMPKSLMIYLSSILDAKTIKKANYFRAKLTKQ